MDEYQNKEFTEFAFRKRQILKDFDDGKLVQATGFQADHYTARRDEKSAEALDTKSLTNYGCTRE
jgi:hypothetical protein